MKKFFKFSVLLFSVFLISCAAGRKVSDPGLIASSSKKKPKWITNIRNIKKAKKDRIYFYGIGEKTNERAANEEAARDAAMQFSRYILTEIETKEEEKDSSTDEISKSISEKINTQVTKNFLTEQYWKERYIERRFNNKYDKKIEFYKVYTLFSFPKLQSKEVLRKVIGFLNEYTPRSKKEKKYIGQTRKTLKSIIKSMDKEEALMIDVR